MWQFFPFALYIAVEQPFKPLSSDKGKTPQLKHSSDHSNNASIIRNKKHQH
jgi:hypothetical protein